MVKAYLPLKPKPVGFRDLLPFLFGKLYETVFLLVGLFIPYREQVEPPERELPANSQLSEEQRKQCKEIFDLSEARLDGLSKRASALFSTVGLLAPFELAAIGFIWKQYLDTRGMPLALYCVFVASLILLALAGVAVIRASNVITVEQPGIEAVLDTENGIVRNYDRHRDAMCLLWCAMANNAIANRRFDHLRAGTSLVVLSATMLLLGGVILSMMSPAGLHKTDQSKVRINALESKIEAVENRSKVLEKRLESIISQRQGLEPKARMKPRTKPSVNSEREKSLALP